MPRKTSHAPNVVPRIPCMVSPRAAQKFLHHTQSHSCRGGFPSPPPEVAFLYTISLYFYPHSQLFAPASPCFSAPHIPCKFSPRRSFAPPPARMPTRSRLRALYCIKPHAARLTWSLPRIAPPPCKTLLVHALNHNRAICRSPCAKVQAASPLHVPRASCRSLRAVSQAAPALCRTSLAPPHQTVTFVNRRPRLPELRFQILFRYIFSAHSQLSAPASPCFSAPHSPCKFLPRRRCVKNPCRV